MKTFPREVGISIKLTHLQNQSLHQTIQHKVTQTLNGAEALCHNQNKFTASSSCFYIHNMGIKYKALYLNTDSSSKLLVKLTHHCLVHCPIMILYITHEMDSWMDG
uniref:Uncharacterized protein MANES_09G068300 n=1 Tax=Rhizophora mucronata TaxID=61149 RepID=A0A2P2J185_RHIMU